MPGVGHAWPVHRMIVAIAFTAMASSGCAADPPGIGTSGVDRLVIPTPAPDPNDFVDRIDNPWLPFTPGSSWTYDTARPGVTVTVTVLDRAAPIAGLTATVVAETGGPGGRRTRWYAQDRAGNVWLLGEAGRWKAGVAGAEAGIAMLAEPRVGDGYLQQHAPGVTRTRATVTEVPAPDRDGPGAELVVAETDLVTDTSSTGSYTRGVGLVGVVGSGQDTVTLTLRDHRIG
jgi:hypothetical protein